MAEHKNYIRNGWYVNDNGIVVHMCIASEYYHELIDGVCEGCGVAVPPDIKLESLKRMTGGPPRIIDPRTQSLIWTPNDSN